MGQVRHGQGTMTYSKTGVVYRGNFVKNEKQGWGVMDWPTGATYEGEWLQNQRTGFGTYVWPDKSKYLG